MLNFIDKVIDHRSIMFAISAHVSKLIELVDVHDLWHFLVVFHHELIKDRAWLYLHINSQTSSKFMMNQCVIDVGIVASVEFNKIRRNVVAIHCSLERLREETADYIESEPILGTKNTINRGLCRNIPNLIILYCILWGRVLRWIELMLLFLKDSLKSIVAGYVIWIFLSTELNVLSCSLFIEYLSFNSKRILQSIENVSQKLWFWLRNKRPDFHSRK